MLGRNSTLALLFLIACGPAAKPTNPDIAARANLSATEPATPPAAASMAAKTTASATAPATTSASAPTPKKDVVAVFTPPSPYTVVAGAAADSEFKMHPLKGALLVSVVKDKRLRTMVLVTGDTVRDAPELVKGLPGVPDQIVGTWPDAAFASHGSTVHAWVKDQWVEVSKSGPLQIAAWGSGAVGLAPKKPATQFEMLTVPGAAAPDKLDVPPVRDKTCLMTPLELHGLEGGEIAILAEGCDHFVVMETWTPTKKKWTQSKLNFVVTGEEISEILSPTEMFLSGTTTTPSDGEPMTGDLLFSLTNGKWKSTGFRGLNDRKSVVTACTPFEKDRPPFGCWSTIRTGGRAYVTGPLFDAGGETKLSTLLLRDQPVKSPITL